MSDIKSYSNSNLKQFETLNRDSNFDKQNEGVTKGKNFQSDKQNDARSSSFHGQRKKVANEKNNKTSVIAFSGKVKQNQAKNVQLHIIHQNDKIQTTHEREDQKETHSVVQNLELSQTTKQNQVHSQKIQVANKSSQKKLQIPELDESNKIVKQIKQSVSHRVQNQTAQALHKNQLTALDQSNAKFNKIYPQNFNKDQTSSVFQQCSHIMRPIRQNYKMNHVFNRHLSCSLAEPVMFQIPKTNGDESLTSQKTSRLFCSEFKMSLNKKGQKHQLGTLKSNFSGSIYNFYPKNSEAIYFSIVFSNRKEQNFRFSQIYVNKRMTDNYQQSSNQQVIPYRKMQSLAGLYQINCESKNNFIYRAQSVLPTWSEKHKGYSLNFGTQGVMPSTKNTILADESNKQVMRFYKSSHLTYNMTFENPLSWIVAYGFSLASTDFKWATE